MSRKQVRKKENIFNQVGSESEKKKKSRILAACLVCLFRENPHTVRSACIRGGRGGPCCLFLELNVTQHEAEILYLHVLGFGGVCVAE